MPQVVGIPSSPNGPLLGRSARKYKHRLAFLQSGAGIKHNIPCAINSQLIDPYPQDTQSSMPLTSSGIRYIPAWRTWTCSGSAHALVQPIIDVRPTYIPNRCTSTITSATLLLHFPLPANTHLVTTIPTHQSWDVDVMLQSISSPRRVAASSPLLRCTTVKKVVTSDDLQLSALSCS
jgi:hypothetical protein